MQDFVREILKDQNRRWTEYEILMEAFSKDLFSALSTVTLQRRNCTGALTFQNFLQFGAAYFAEKAQACAQGGSNNNGGQTLSDTEELVDMLTKLFLPVCGVFSLATEIV